MSDNNKPDGRGRDEDIERWARTLGVSKERLAALIKEVLEERQALGKTDAGRAARSTGIASGAQVRH